jgi:hypothetical protein
MVASFVEDLKIDVGELNAMFRQEVGQNYAGCIIERPKSRDEPLKRMIITTVRERVRLFVLLFLF